MSNISATQYAGASCFIQCPIQVVFTIHWIQITLLRVTRLPVQYKLGPCNRSLILYHSQIALERSQRPSDPPAQPYPHSILKALNSCAATLIPTPANKLLISLLPTLTTAAQDSADRTSIVSHILPLTSSSSRTSPVPRSAIPSSVGTLQLRTASSQLLLPGKTEGPTLPRAIRRVVCKTAASLVVQVDVGKFYDCIAYTRVKTRPLFQSRYDV